MYYTVSEFKIDPSHMEDIIAFVGEVKQEVRRLGAVYSHLVNLGAGTAANICLFESRETALKAMVQSRALYRMAEKKGLIITGTLNPRAGTVIFDYFAYNDNEEDELDAIRATLQKM